MALRLIPLTLNGRLLHGASFFFVLSYSHEAYLDYGGVHF